MRLPEPRGRELLRPLRRVSPSRRARRDDVEPRPGRDRRGARRAAELRGPALVVRAGGGRAGESFETAGARTLIGRSPDCDVFLDDVTVSRRHAEIVREGDDYVIRDLGSLNGTFVNRHRIESSVLSADDEVQIGKYRMTFLCHATLASARVGDLSHEPLSERGEPPGSPHLPPGHDAARRPSRGCTRSARSASGCAASSRTSRSRRSATSRIRACSSRAGRGAATASSRRATSSGSRRSCACSATSSSRSG